MAPSNQRHAAVVQGGHRHYTTSERIAPAFVRLAFIPRLKPWAFPLAFVKMGMLWNAFTSALAQPTRPKIGIWHGQSFQFKDEGDLTVPPPPPEPDDYAPDYPSAPKPKPPPAPEPPVSPLLAAAMLTPAGIVVVFCGILLLKMLTKDEN